MEGKKEIDDCKKKWKSLRDYFVRELRKKKRRKSGDEVLYLDLLGHYLTC